jgi:nucleotide-binding universal stress UspA family protein
MDLAVASDEPIHAMVVEEIARSPGSPSARGQAPDRKAARAARDAARECEHRIRKLANDRSLRTRVTHLVGSIDECAGTAAEHASCVVIARTGADAGEEPGSRLEAIARQTQRPLLVVPSRYRPLQRIVTGYADKELGELVLNTASDLATALKLPLEVITVGHDRDDCYPIQERAKGHLRYTKAHVTYLRIAGEPADALVERTAADRILVVGASGHSRLHRLILGTVTEQVIDNAVGPVLVSTKPPPDPST